MSEQDSASERLQKKIDKLTQEKNLLRSRLNILKREDNPSSRSREQTRRTEQIEDINNRITLIEEELKQKRYFLARSENKPIVELSNLLQNLSVNTEKEERKKGNLSKLEEFINLTANSEMVFHSPTREGEKNNRDVVIDTMNTENKSVELPQLESNAAQSNEPLAIITNLNKQKVSFANNDDLGANKALDGVGGAQSLPLSSTPKQSTLKTDVKSTMIYGSKVAPSTFEFPPTYENPQARAARLEKERILKNEFDKKMELEYNMNNKPGKYTGAIPKFSKVPRQPQEVDLDLELLQYEQKMIEDSIKADQRFKSRNLELFSGTNPNKNSEQNLLMTTDVKSGGVPYATTGSSVGYKQTPQKKSGFDRKPINLIDDTISYQNLDQYSPQYNGDPSQFLPQNDNSNQNQSNQATQRNAQMNIPVNQNTLNQTNAQINQGQNEVVRDSFLRRLRKIPEFGGDTFKDLRNFIDASETLYNSCQNESEEQEFYEQMVLQLRGEPKLIVSRLENLNWANVKEILLRKFSFLSNKNVLTSQIENLHQEEGESMTKYTERARNLLREKNSVYSQLTEEQRLEHNRMARRAFSKGILDEDLRRKLLIRGAGSLEDAISFAIESENDALTEVRKSDLYCTFCHTNGHREKFCRRKASENTDIGKLASAIRSLGFNNRTNQNYFRGNRQNFGNMNRNFTPNFVRNGFNPWNQNRNNDSYFPNGNRNNNLFNRNPNWNRTQNWNQNRNQNWNQNQNQSNQNPNQNGNFMQNRGNFQSNGRQQQRTNNFVRNARINAVQTIPQREMENNDFLFEQTEN